MAEVPLPATTYRLVGWYDADHLVVAVNEVGRDETGRPTTPDAAALKVVRIVGGGVVHTVNLPNRRVFSNIQLAPATDLPKAAKKHAF